MDVFSIVTLFGGLAFFLYGMKAMSSGLEKSSNGKFNKNLQKMTDNRFLAMLFGMGITLAVQSSSAVTVMLVGLVNSGIVEFHQTIGVLMGANIGKTLPAWLLSFAGIDSDVVWLRLLKPVNLSLLFAVAGILLTMISKKQKLQSIGNAFLGFAILMFGMSLMSDAMQPLAQMPQFTHILTAFENPLVAVLIGAAFTGLIQSSAASVGILQALSVTGDITYGMAIPIIMGQNIGTCVTAVISSIGVTRNAKKVAAMHLSINILGTVICLIPFCICSALLDIPILHSHISPPMIAVVHTVFNILTTLILMPFTKQLGRLADILVPNRKQQEEAPRVMLDERLLAVPSMAVKNSLDTIFDMCRLSQKAFQTAMSTVMEFDEKAAETVARLESTIDQYEDQLSTYMMKLSRISTTDSESRDIAKVLHTIDDLERIGDHAINLVGVARDLHDGKVSFSEDAKFEIKQLTEATTEILRITTESFCNADVELAASVEPLRKVIDTMILQIKRNHIARLQSGECTTELGFALRELLTGYERVSGHCSNIAVATIETEHGTFDVHGYVDRIKHQNDGEFDRLFDLYRQRFSLNAGADAAARGDAADAAAADQTKGES